MNANKQTVQATVQPEQQLQLVPQTEGPEIPAFRCTIGSTTYIVRVHFSKTSKETLADKVKKMLVEEARAHSFKSIIH